MLISFVHVFSFQLLFLAHGSIVSIRLSLLNGVTFSSSRLPDQTPRLLPATELSIITAREERWNRVAIAHAEYASIL